MTAAPDAPTTSSAEVATMATATTTTTAATPAVTTSMQSNAESTASSVQSSTLSISTTDIPAPLDSDVICGRGGGALRHPGNQTYRRIVTLNKGLYTTCKKQDKLKISRSIVAAIREQNGRFLERDSATKLWYDIGDRKAVEKTSQALREGQPKLKKKIAELENKGELPDGGAAAVTLEEGEPTRDKKISSSSSSSTVPASGGAEQEAAATTMMAEPEEIQSDTPKPKIHKSIQAEEAECTTTPKLANSRIRTASNLSTVSSLSSSSSSTSSGVAAAAAATAFIAKRSPSSEPMTRKEPPLDVLNEVADEIRGLPLDGPNRTQYKPSTPQPPEFHDSDVTQVMGNHFTGSIGTLSRNDFSQDSYQDSFGDFDPSTLEHVQEEYWRRSLDSHNRQAAATAAAAATDPVMNTAQNYHQMDSQIKQGDNNTNTSQYHHQHQYMEHSQQQQQQQQPQDQSSSSYNDSAVVLPHTQLESSVTQTASNTTAKRKLSIRTKLRPSIHMRFPNHEFHLGSAGAIDASCRSIMSEFSALGESMKSIENYDNEEVMIWDASAQNLGATGPTTSFNPSAVNAESNTNTMTMQDRRSYFTHLKQYRARQQRQTQNGINNSNASSNSGFRNSNQSKTSIAHLNDEVPPSSSKQDDNDYDDGLQINASCMLESNYSLVSNLSFLQSGGGAFGVTGGGDGASIMMASPRSSISTISKDAKTGAILMGGGGGNDFDLASTQSFQSKQSIFSSSISKAQQYQYQQQMFRELSDDSGVNLPRGGGGGGGNIDAMDASICQSMQSLAVSEFSAVGGGADFDEDGRNKLLDNIEISVEATPAQAASATPSLELGMDDDL